MVIGVGFVDEAHAALIDGDNARLGAVGHQMREAFFAAIRVTQHGNGCPEKVGGQVGALFRIDAKTKLERRAVVGCG